MNSGTPPSTRSDQSSSMFSSPLPSQILMEPNSILSTKRERELMTPSFSDFSMVYRHTQTAPPVSKGKISRRFAQDPPRLVTYKEADEKTLKKMLMTSTNVYDPTKPDVSFLEQCFIIEEKIGEGSFGEVIRAISIDDGRAYAIKISLTPFRTKNDRLIKLREVYKHEKLPKHNNLVQFIKAWEERGRLYIQTELCEESLYAYIKRKHEISHSVMWSIFADIIMALDILHQRNLIHLDVKPENIFITKEMIFKLGDFGLIYDFEKDPPQTHDEGDSKYLAPEVLNFGPTKAADIFSLGVTLLEVGTDLDLPSQGDAWHKIRSGNIPERFLRNMNQDMRQLVFSMLNTNFEERPTTRQLCEKFQMKLMFRQMHLSAVNMRHSLGIHLRTIFFYIYAIVACLFSCLYSPLVAAKNAIVKKKTEISVNSSPYHYCSSEQRPQTTPDLPPRLIMPTRIQFDHDYSDDEQEFDLRKRRYPFSNSNDDTDTGDSSTDKETRRRNSLTPSPRQRQLFTPERDSPISRKTKNLDASGDWAKGHALPRSIAFDDADLEDDYFAMPATSQSAPNSIRSRPRIPLREKALLGGTVVPKLDFSILDDVDGVEEKKHLFMKPNIHRRRITSQQQGPVRRSPRLAYLKFDRTGSTSSNGKY